MARSPALLLTLAVVCACPVAPEVPPVVDGAEGEGEGEGEGEPPTPAEVIDAFCDRLEACGNATAVECDAGIAGTFADLEDNGCADVVPLLLDFYTCSLTLSCGALAGPPPAVDEPCGDLYAAADSAIDARGCFGRCDETLGARDGCDCGCGDDPDCAGTGCATPGCAAPGCDFCYDAAGALVDCPAG